MGRAWCGHARPTKTTAPVKFGAGKFCRFAQRKNKKQIMLGDGNV